MYARINFKYQFFYVCCHYNPHMDINFYCQYIICGQLFVCFHSYLIHAFHCVLLRVVKLNAVESTASNEKQTDNLMNRAQGRTTRFNSCSILIVIHSVYDDENLIGSLRSTDAPRLLFFLLLVHLLLIVVLGFRNVS